MPRHFFLLLSITFSLLFATQAAAATPLLQEGKKTIYQRIVTHPGANIVQSPSADAAITKANVIPFSVLYVYARKDNFIQVGPLGNAPLGWIAKEKATDWNQSLTLLLTERRFRNPVLFFKSESALKEICQVPDMAERLRKIQGAVTANDDALLQKEQVIAAESNQQEGNIAADRFYLMPILAMNDPFEGVKFLKVASIDPGNAQNTIQSNTQDAGNDSTGSANLKPRMAIAFVIDTTISMRPYIEQSLDVVRTVYDKLQNSKLSDNVAFGVVTFRSNPEASPGTEYESQVISDLTTAKNRHSLESNLAKVREASTSTHTFRENSPSGVKTALDSLSWDDYPTRLIILITDAGPLQVTDPYSTIKMDMPELADYARTKGVRILALHIKSPKGQDDHAEAEAAYKSLTKDAEFSNYLSIAAQTPTQGAKEFKKISLTLTEGVVNMVRMTLDGKLVTKPDAKASASTPEAMAQNLAANLGYAMQLDYLGKLNEVRAPSVVDSWIADMDLQKLARGNQAATVEVAVLLTKNQLNDLSTQLKIIIDNAERTKKTDAKDFFQGILSASTRAARDPNSPMPQGKNLAQMGVLAEFLDGLPYKSDVMLLREEDWYRMSIGQQTTFINRLKSRLARYEEYDKDSSHWESFGATNAGDWMYRVPLNMLP